jgi:hypothetical protein
MSIVDIGTYILGVSLRLGFWEPFQPSEVLYIKIFTCDNKTSRIVHEQMKKFLMIEGIPISVVTHVLLTGDVREDPIAIATYESTFMNTNVNKNQRLCHQNEEKEEKIKEMEEKFQRVKINERSLQSFKVSAKKARNELEEAIINMYANMHLFQDATVIIIEHNN